MHKVSSGTRRTWRLRTALAGWITFIGLLQAGCATHFDRIQPVRDLFFAGRLNEASAQLAKHRDLRLRNTEVKDLDRAIIRLADGRPKEAEAILRSVRDKLETNRQFSLAERAGALLSDENLKAYPGEDYERVFVRIFLSLSNLMAGGRDAGAYALQVTETQNDIIANINKKHADDQALVSAYKQVALAPYIRAMLNEESPLTYGEAEKARVQVAEWAPDFRDAEADIQRVKFEQPIKAGHGAVYVFSMVGRGPVKIQEHAVATQAALLVADRIVSANSSQGLPPTLAPVLVPKVVTSVPLVDAVRVSIGQETLGDTATMVHVGGMAQQQFDANFPYILGETIARRVVKKAVIYGLKEGLDTQGGSLPSLAMNAVGIAWEATETADTRCWSLLPDEIQVLRVELPEGKHMLNVQPIRRGGSPVGQIEQAPIRVRAGRNTYVMGFFPDRNLVGKLLVSDGE